MRLKLDVVTKWDDVHTIALPVLATVARLWTPQEKPTATINLPGGEFNTGRKHMAYRWWLLYTTEATDKQTVRQTDRYMDSIIA